MLITARLVAYWLSFGDRRGSLGGLLPSHNFG